jgi:type IX secretion system PorP/SprF family membrane protein
MVLVGLSSYSSAQDIHFSQFYQSPLNLNPALTGVMDCNIRLVGNYRNQWAAILKNNAYSTYSFSYDQKFTAFRKDYFGVGATFWGDRAGEVDFGTLQARLSGSFSKHLGGGRDAAHYLTVGVDGGLSQRSIDFLKARYGNQNVNGEYNSSIPSGEEFDNNSFLFGDLSFGVLWFSTFDERTSVYVGGAYHHINKPNQSFQDDVEVTLYPKYTIHAGGEIPFRGSRMSLVPGIVTFFQGPSFQVNGGTNLRFQLSGSRYQRQAFQIGLWARFVNMYQWNEENIDDYTVGADAIIVSSRFQYNNFDFGFSYDINVSELRQGANGNGSFEFSVIYLICGPERRGVYCPNF